MATYTVKRSQWYRGNGSDQSKLLREDGQRCCIGFVGQQCGIKDADLLDNASVRSCDESVNGWPSWFIAYPSSEDLQAAYSVNDSEDTTDEYREARLTAIFERYGDTLLFID
jgi:hypothetical protein